MDWAAAAANVLAWTGWGQASGLTTADAIFQYFQSHWTDEPGWSLDAWIWWFTGRNPDRFVSDVSSVRARGGGFYRNLDASNYIQTQTDPTQAMSSLDQFLHNGEGVVLGLQCNDKNDSWYPVSHAVTAWGFTYDSTKSPTDSGYYTGVYITDSDDNEAAAGTTSTPELKYYAITYSAKDGAYYLTDYDGRNTLYHGNTIYIDEVSGLQKYYTGIQSKKYDDLGDQNQLYDQGQVILEANRITYSSQFGIVVSGARSFDSAGLPKPGPTAPLREINTDNQVPGVVIQNNVIAFGPTGIRVSGYSLTAGESVGSVPFARIVNNTIVGGGQSTTQYKSLVDFENIPNTPPTPTDPDGSPVAEGMTLDTLIDNGGTIELINNWINQTYGVTFKFADGTPARLVQVGDQLHTPPTTSGYAFDSSPQGDMVSNADIGSFFLTNDNHGHKPGSPLLIQYAAPTAAASGLILDIDTGSGGTFERWLIEALDAGGNVLASVTLKAGDPGTGSGKATPWKFGPFPTAVIGTIRITYTGTKDGAGLGFDNFYARGVPGVGIQVDKYASPTILNNVIANTDVGIKIYDDPTNDPTYAATAVVGTTAYYNDGRNSEYFDANDKAGTDVDQTFPITLTSDPFVNAAAGNFYPAAGSAIIDSAIDSLPDRPNMVKVREPLGIPDSPIIVPAIDALGQLRVDDPTVAPPSGMGYTIYKDRGAIDRADFADPIATLVSPMDNGGSGDYLDHNPAPNDVTIDMIGDAVVDHFTIQLDDAGAGVDNSTITASNVQLLEDGKQLVEGFDYFFVYDSTNHTITLSAAAGVWESKHTYTVLLSNGIRDLAANPIQSNRSDGKTEFNITLAGYDFGDAPMNAQVPDPNNPGQFIVVDATNPPDGASARILTDPLSGARRSASAPRSPAKSIR